MSGTRSWRLTGATNTNTHYGIHDTMTEVTVKKVSTSGMSKHQQTIVRIIKEKGRYIQKPASPIFIRCFGDTPPTVGHIITRMLLYAEFTRCYRTPCNSLSLRASFSRSMHRLIKRGILCYQERNCGSSKYYLYYVFLTDVTGKH